MNIKTTILSKSLWLWAFLFLHLTVTKGQNTLHQLPFSLEHFNTNSGLPQNSVQDIVQDSQGNIWIGTFGGLVKYDGADFKVFSHEVDSTITAIRLLYIAIGIDDKVYGVSADGKILVVENNQFKEYTIKHGTRFPYGLDVDSQGRLMCFTRGRVWTIQNDSVVPHPEYPDYELEFDLIRTYYNHEQGHSYLLANSGLLKLSKNGTTPIPYYNGKFVNGMIMKRDTSFIHTSMTTDVWIGDSLVKQIPNSGRQEDRSGFSVTNEGVVWEAHDLGVRRINQDLSYEEYANPYRMPTLKYRSAFVDIEENIWIGSNDNGLIRIRPDLFKTYIDYKYPTSVNIQGIYPDTHGVWVGLNCEGIGFYSFDKQTITTEYIPKRGDYNDASGGCVTSFERDSRGRLWIGTYGDGLIRLQDDELSIEVTTEDGLVSNNVLNIIEKEPGVLILGTNIGIQLYNVDSKKLIEPYKNTPLGKERIHQIFIDSKSQIWYGTYHGVYVDVGDSVLHFGLEEGLPDLNCRTFYEDEFGDIWIGTYGNGLARYKNGKIKSIGVENGLFNGVVSSFVRNGDFLWMTCNKGLYAASFSELLAYFDREVPNIHCISFGMESGLNTDEFNGSFRFSGFKHDNGKLYFASMNGLVEMNSSKLPIIPTPDIFTNEVYVNGGLQLWAENLKVPTDAKRLSFQISVPTYAFPRNVTKQYRLLGYDTNWNEVPNAGRIDFTNLEGGNYELELRARSLMSDSPNYSFSSLMFYVEMPWYKNGRYLVVITLSVIAVLLATLIFIRSKSKRDQLKLEKLIRKRTNELRENKNNLESLIENNDQLIWSIDKNYDLINFNNKFKEAMPLIFGFAPVPGMNLIQATNQKTQDFWLKHFQQTMKGNPVSLEIKYWFNDEEKVMSTGLFPIKGSESEIIGIVGFSADITQEVKRKEELKIAKAEAEQAAQAKADFLATMSHEIRTPLNGIIGTSSLLQREELNNSQNELVETIRLSGDVLITIINEILDFSKLESGKGTLENISFNPNQLVEDTISLVQLKAQEKGLILSTNFKSKLPRIVKGDSTKIKQVLLNLLNNAIKFTQKGSVIVDASLTKANELKFEVKDTGIGIAPSQLGNLFVPFHQLDRSTSRKYGGTGLGLSISKKLTELMGGTISATSVFQEGTTFTFQIPVEVEENDTEQMELYSLPKGLRKIGIVGLDNQEVFTSLQNATEQVLRTYNTLNEAINESDFVLLFSESEEVIEHNIVLRVSEEQAQNHKQLMNSISNQFTLIANKDLTNKPASILVAEDNIVNQKIIELLLKKLNHSADIVANGLEAVEAMDRHAYDIILMDVQMPEMDGLEATRRIRAEFPENQQPFIIAVTANAMEGDREKCIDAGMNDYLAKPVTLKSLESCLTKWILELSA